MKNTNKYMRVLAGRKVLARRALQFGWGSKIEDLPHRIRVALTTNSGIDPKWRTDKKHGRKGFSQHGSGWKMGRQAQLSPNTSIRQDIVELADRREAKAEISQYQ